MEKEIWKDIVGYEGFYQISNFGRVKSIPHVVKRRKHFTFLTKECILIPRIGRGNYHRVSLSKDAKSTTFLVHRLTALHWVNNPDPINKIEVNHKTGDKNKNSANDLEWTTRSENMKHAFLTGLTLGPPKNYPFKPIAQIDRNSKEVIKIWPSIKEAAISLGKEGYANFISEVCRGGKRGKPTAYGYIWKFQNSENKK